MKDKLQQIRWTNADKVSVTAEIELTTEHFHVQHNNPLIFLPMNEYQAVNLLWALKTGLQGTEPDINTGDWIGELEYDLERRLNAVDPELLPNRPWPGEEGD